MKCLGNVRRDYYRCTESRKHYIGLSRSDADLYSSIYDNGKQRFEWIEADEGRLLCMRLPRGHPALTRSGPGSRPQTFLPLLLAAPGIIRNSTSTGHIFADQLASIIASIDPLTLFVRRPFILLTGLYNLNIHRCCLKLAIRTLNLRSSRL